MAVDLSCSPCVCTVDNVIDMMKRMVEWIMHKLTEQDKLAFITINRYAYQYKLDLFTDIEIELPMSRSEFRDLQLFRAATSLAL